MTNNYQGAMPRVGYAYVPAQKFENLYSIEDGFKRGTLFKDLDLPYGVYEGGITCD